MVESYKGGNCLTGRAFCLSNTRHSAQDEQNKTLNQITRQATFGPNLLFPRQMYSFAATKPDT